MIIVDASTSSMSRSSHAERDLPFFLICVTAGVSWTSARTRSRKSSD